MSNSVLFKFLDAACDADTLLQIRREIEGEMAGYEDESDSDEEGEDVTTRVRQTSPTVFALLKKFGAKLSLLLPSWFALLSALSTTNKNKCKWIVILGRTF